MFNFLKKEQSQEQLMQKYEKTEDAKKRCELVDKITDKVHLTKIALKDPDRNVRLRAASHIDDQKVLSEIAEKDTDWGLRSAAVKKITDQSVLEKTAAHDPERTVRAIAVERIQDQAMLKKFAAQQNDEFVAKAAVRAITDRPFLEQLLMSEDSSAGIRKEAAKRLAKLPGQSRLKSGCWVFSCYDRAKVAGLMLVNPSFYEAQNVVGLFKNAYSISPDVIIEHVEAEEWDAPGITSTETGFDWNIDEVDAKKNQYLVSRCGFSENQASMTKWTTLPYPNAGLLLVIVNFSLDI